MVLISNRIVSLDYEDGYKAQLTEEIKREIKNRLWPESSTIPKERSTVGGPEAISVPLTKRGAVRGPEEFFVPWTKPVYKMTTAMQEDPIHQDTVFPKQFIKRLNIQVRLKKVTVVIGKFDIHCEDWRYCVRADGPNGRPL